MAILKCKEKQSEQKKDRQEKSTQNSLTMKMTIYNKNYE